MRLIPILLLITACSVTDERHMEIDPRLQDAVTEFFHQADLRGLNIRPYDLIARIGGGKDVGDFHWDGSIGVIMVNASFFENGNIPDSLALQYIVFHEFGHWMGRAHINTFSIMNPNTYAGEYRNDPVKRKLLIDELFKNGYN